MLCYHCMHDKGGAEVCPYCHKSAINDPQLHHLPPGTVVGGRYTVGRVLGEGGFGITYIGLDNTLDIVVAVKEYFPYGCSHRSGNLSAEVSVSGGSDEFYHKGKERFLKEAKTIAKFLKDPGIVDIRDFFEENNTAYIVMEYLEGVDLRRYLKQHGTMAPDTAFRMLLPVMRSLEKMHRVGIIHRDISPDNIMYQPDGSLKLMDFGAARDYDGGNRSLSVMLKHGYAPEEQYRRNGEQGPWTDVYGICATLYRCITGKTPDEAIDRLSEDNLKKPSELGVEISPQLEEALLYGLAVRRKDRCPDMTELLRLINEALDAPQRIEPTPEKPVPAKPIEDDKTVFADQTSAGEEIKTSFADHAPAAEEIKTAFAEHAPAQDQFKTTLADPTPAAEEIKTSFATYQPVAENRKTSLAEDTADKTLPADMTIPVQPAAKPVPSIPDKTPAIPLSTAEKPANTQPKKKSFPKVIIAVAAVLVAAIVILVIVNPFAKSHEPTKEEIAEQVSELDKAAYQYLCEQIDVTDAFNEPWGDDYEHRRAIEFNHPDSISSKPIVIDTDFMAELSKTTAGDFKKTFSVNHVEEHTFDNGNQFEIELTSESSSGSFRIFTKLFSTPHSETDMDSCRIKEIILDDDIENDEEITPFRYGNITEKTSLKEIVSDLGTPSMIYLYTDNNNNQKEVRSDFKLVYEGDDGFHIEFWLRYDMDKDSASISCANFYLASSSDESASSMDFSVDEDSQTAQDFESLASYIMANVDLSSYDQYQDKDTGKNYYVVSDSGQYGTSWNLPTESDSASLSKSLTVEGSAITVGQDTVKDLLGKGFEYSTNSKPDKNNKYSQSFLMKSGNNEMFVYLEPTVGINPESARIATVCLSKTDLDFEYMGLTKEDDLLSAISKLGNPDHIFIAKQENDNYYEDGYIQLEYYLDDNTELQLTYVYQDNKQSCRFDFFELKDTNLYKAESE